MRKLTQNELINLTDLATQLRENSNPDGWLDQLKIVREHPLMRQQDGYRIFFTHLNDSWRFDQYALFDLINKNSQFAGTLNMRFFTTTTPVFDEAQFWSRLLLSRRWWQRDPWRAKAQNDKYYAYLGHLGAEGGKMLLAGRLWPNSFKDDVLYDYRGSIDESTYLIYDIIRKHKLEKILTGSSAGLFTTPYQLERILETVEGVAAAKIHLMRTIWLPEFLSKRDYAQTQDLADDYIIALYPKLYDQGAKRYYQRMKLRRRRTLQVTIND